MMSSGSPRPSLDLMVVDEDQSLQDRPKHNIFSERTVSPQKLSIDSSSSHSGYLLPFPPQALQIPNISRIASDADIRNWILRSATKQERLLSAVNYYQGSANFFNRSPQLAALQQTLMCDITSLLSVPNHLETLPGRMAILLNVNAFSSVSAVDGKELVEPEEVAALAKAVQQCLPRAAFFHTKFDNFSQHAAYNRSLVGSDLSARFSCIAFYVASGPLDGTGFFETRDRGVTDILDLAESLDAPGSTNVVVCYNCGSINEQRTNLIHTRLKSFKGRTVLLLPSSGRMYSSHRDDEGHLVFSRMIIAALRYKPVIAHPIF